MEAVDRHRRRRPFVVLSWEEEEEEEEEEADSSNLFPPLVAALVVDNGGGFCMVALCSSVDDWPQMLGIMAGIVTPCSSSSRQWYVHGWYCWLRCFSAVFSSVVGRPVLPGFLQLLDRVVHCPFTQRQASMVQAAQMYVFVQFLNKVGDLPVVPLERFWSLRQVPWSRQCKLSGSAAVPQLQFIEGRQHPCLYAEADPHGLGDHGDSPVALRQDGPCCAGRESSTGAVVEKTVVLTRLHSLRNSMRSDLCESGHCLEQLIVVAMR